MSEGSIPAFGRTGFLKSLGPPRLGKMLARLYVRVRRLRDTDDAWTDEPPVRAPALESRAEQTIREYLAAHAANLERAVRLMEKAVRLEKTGTPSESARNRAERAHGEVAAELAILRASFVEAARGEDGAPRAFDRAARLLCPAFAPHLPAAARR